MRKAASFILAAALTLACLSITSCGSATISGDPQSYSNADGSFSIDLPTADESSWEINEKTASSILDISDHDDTVNIRVQCVAKSQVQPQAPDLEAYMEYSRATALGGILDDAALEDMEAETPEFITGSKIYGFDLSGDARGIVFFMESAKCYYTYFAMTVSDAYGRNEDALLDSVLTIKEITDANGGDQGKSGQQDEAKN